MTEGELTEREIFYAQHRLAYVVLVAQVIGILAAIAGAVLIAVFVGGLSSGFALVGASTFIASIVRLNTRIAR